MPQGDVEKSRKINKFFLLLLQKAMLMNNDEIQKSRKFTKFFHNVVHVYYVYGWRKRDKEWKWHLVTAFATEKEYTDYVEYHEQKGRKLQVYHANLVKRTSRKIYETASEQDVDLPEISI